MPGRVHSFADSLVAPYLPYMRQDAVFAPGQVISQHVIGHLPGDAYLEVVRID